MSGKSIIFDKKNIKKSNFHKNKKLFTIDGINVDKILVSKKESYGTNKSVRYFIRYNDNDVIRPLCIKLPQMIGCIKHSDSNKTMSFKVIDNTLLKKYTKISRRVSILRKIKFDEDSDKNIKTKIKSYGDKINTNFQGKKAPKENAPYKCLSLMLDSVFKVSKKYFPQTFLEECKYEIKRTKMENFINDDPDPSSSDNETDSDSDNETINESNNDFDNESDNETDSDESNE